VTEKFAGMLRCSVCNDTELLSEGDTDRYLDTAWPRCCGRPMRLER
jgi:phage FluMu protein Com